MPRPERGRADPLRRGLLAAPLVLAPAWARPAPTLELSELMALLARQRSGQARFTEMRHVQGLDTPLQSSGTLSFEAPDRFTRRTLLPREETMAADGNRLTLTRGGRTRSLALDATPQALPIVEAMRATLTGNAAVLTRYFTPALSGDAERWTLALVPRDRAVSTVLRNLRIGGSAGRVTSVELWMADGDWSVMTIEPLQPAAGAASR